MYNECCFCREKKNTTKIKFSATFTNYDKVKTNYICDLCSKYMDNKYRRSSWIITENSDIFIKNTDFYKQLFINKEIPFKIFYTTTFKKHGYFKAPFNLSNDNFTVQYNDNHVKITKENKDILEKIIFLLLNKTTKREIITGMYSVKTIKKIGIDKIKEIENAFIRGTLLFNFLVEVARSE